MPLDNWKSCCPQAVMYQSGDVYVITGCGVEVKYKNLELATREFCKKVAIKKVRQK
jgi:hypothetical protein